MGAPMASNLLKQDYDVTVYNRTHENAVRSPNREPPLRRRLVKRLMDKILSLQW